MKAKVKETGEIIDVKCLYSVTYSRLDCNGKIIEEYDEDELEFEPGPKMVSLDKVCDFLIDNLKCSIDIDEYGNGTINESYWCSKQYNTISEFIEGLRKEFE